MEPSLITNVPGIAHKNKFRIGDAVVHPPTMQKGLVVHVQHDWVKFESMNTVLPGGKPKICRFNYKKVKLLATSEQIKSGFEQFQKQRVAAAKKANSPLNRLARWVGSRFAPKANQQPQSAR